MKNSVTIKDVAKAAGCSHTTVSLVMKNSPEITENTRRRVIMAAEKLGYVPNLAARALRDAKTNTIGIITRFGYDATRSSLIAKTASSLRSSGYQVILSDFSEDGEGADMNLRQFLQNQTDGVVALLHQAEVGKYATIFAENATPAVFLLGVHGENESCDYVTVDRREGTGKAISHLLAIGYEKIGMFFEPTEGVYTPPKLAGFRQEMSQAGIEDWEQFLYPLAHENIGLREAGWRAGGEFMKVKEKPEALFLPSAAFACGFVCRIRREGMRVPEDLAVVGYEASEEARFLEVPLTMVEPPVKALAEKAAEFILARIEHQEQSPLQQIFEHEIMVRESCGALLKGNRK